VALAALAVVWYAVEWFAGSKGLTAAAAEDRIARETRPADREVTAEPGSSRDAGPEAASGAASEAAPAPAAVSEPTA
jgi:hypothetical protein